MAALQPAEPGARSQGEAATGGCNARAAGIGSGKATSNAHGTAREGESRGPRYATGLEISTGTNVDSTRGAEAKARHLDLQCIAALADGDVVCGLQGETCRSDIAWDGGAVTAAGDS